MILRRRCRTPVRALAAIAVLGGLTAAAAACIAAFAFIASSVLPVRANDTPRMK